MNWDHDTPEAHHSIPLGDNSEILRHAPPQNHRQFQPGMALQRLRREQARAQESQMD